MFVFLREKFPTNLMLPEKATLPLKAGCTNFDRNNCRQAISIAACESFKLIWCFISATLNRFRPKHNISVGFRSRLGLDLSRTLIYNVVLVILM